MKSFFSSLFGSLAALCLFFGGGLLIALLCLAMIAAMGKKQVELERGSYLVLDLSANITEAPPAVDLRILGRHREESLQLRTITRSLRAAAKDDRIRGVFIRGDLNASLSGVGYGTLQEVRAALVEFKASGKPVKAYLTYATTRDYFLASTATELTLDPYGMILMPGLASEPMFFAGAFERFGIGVQVTRVGKFKSYVEPYVRKDMSPENREQIQKLLDDVWGEIVGEIAAARGVKRGEVQQVVDAEGIIRATAAKSAKLVDRVAYRDQVIAELKKDTGRAGSKESFKQIGLADYSRIAKTTESAARGGAKPDKGSGRRGGKVAVVYAEGAIVDGEGEDAGEVGGSRFSRELRRLRQDDEIKAVVLRVNSPGGSASASETILRELALMKKVKPVVVSMGTYAASGGYWISTYGDRIFAEPTTITGSIGVFGLQFDIKRLANDLGFTFDSVKTGRFADAITITRPKTDAELAVFQRMVDWIYEEFISKVAEGRKLKRDYVQQIAEGRVWSGAEALKLGLVDELGGLDAAIAHAAGKARLGDDFRVVEFPRKKELAEAIQEVLERVTPSSARASGFAGQLMQRLEAEVAAVKAFNDPAGVYARLPIDVTIR